MDFILENVIRHVKNFSFSSPAIFVIVLLVFLAVFRKWSILLLTIFVIVLGWGAQDLMIMNIKTNSSFVSLPFLVYCFGGVLVLVLILYSFYKS
jgi:hypothetical protein